MDGITVHLLLTEREKLRRIGKFGMFFEEIHISFSIVHSLSELLRRRSSPCTNTGNCCFEREHRMSADEFGSGCVGAAQHLQRHRSATVSSTDQVYGLSTPNRNVAHHQRERRPMDFGGYGMDRFAAMV